MPINYSSIALTMQLPLQNHREDGKCSTDPLFGVENLLILFQSNFRCQRSTLDHLIFLETSWKVSSTVTIFSDFEKAYVQHHMKICEYTGPIQHQPLWQLLFS